jgi:uncharacterized membrane protein
LKLSETKQNLKKTPTLINNRGYTIVVALALIFVSILLIGYYFVSTLPPEGYTVIYTLDYPQKKAINYPELLVINENNTFNVWVVVENRMGTTQTCEVKQKVVGDTILSFPVETDADNSYSKTIENGEAWETLATVSINKPGSYSVIFELWIYDETGTQEFSHNYCVLKIEVIEQI